MERELPTMTELHSMLIAYQEAGKKREDRLIRMFFVIMGASFFIMFVVSSLRTSKSNMVWGCGIMMVGLLFAVYIIVTSGMWEKDHGIFCHKCKASLIGFLFEWFEVNKNGCKEIPKRVECPKCGSVLAKN